MKVKAPPTPVGEAVTVDCYTVGLKSLQHLQSRTGTSSTCYSYMMPNNISGSKPFSLLHWESQIPHSGTPPAGSVGKFVLWADLAMFVSIAVFCLSINPSVWQYPLLSEINIMPAGVALCVKNWKEIGCKFLTVWYLYHPYPSNENTWSPGSYPNGVYAGRRIRLAIVVNPVLLVLNCWDINSCSGFKVQLQHYRLLVWLPL